VPGAVHDALDNPGVVAPFTNSLGQRTADYFAPAAGCGSPPVTIIPIGGLPGATPPPPALPPPPSPIVALPPTIKLGAGKLTLGKKHVAKLPVTCTSAGAACALVATVTAGKGAKKATLARARRSAASGKPLTLSLRFGRAATARVRKAGRKGLKVAVQVTATAGGKAATVTKTMTAKL
jgi:hypothetical protein